MYGGTAREIVQSLDSRAAAFDHLPDDQAETEIRQLLRQTEGSEPWMLLKLVQLRKGRLTEAAKTKRTRAKPAKELPDTIGLDISDLLPAPESPSRTAPDPRYDRARPNWRRTVNPRFRR